MPEARIAAILGYAELIDRRRREPADPERDGYCERHHALPRSMGGGEGENLVLLPVREHIEAHILLARAIGDQEFGAGMAYAAVMMTHGRSRGLATIEEAASAREMASRAPRSEEFRARMSERVLGEKNPMFGKPGSMTGRKHTPEAIAKMIGRSRPDLAEINRRRVFSLEDRARISELKRGENSSNYSPALLSFELIATGERFHLTRVEARRRLGLSSPDIAHLLSGRQKTAKGFRLACGQAEAA